jgi:hypothetical protein
VGVFVKVRGIVGSGIIAVVGMGVQTACVCAMTVWMVCSDGAQADNKQIITIVLMNLIFGIYFFLEYFSIPEAVILLR